MSRPLFFSQPIRFLRWAAHERPAYFYSVLVGSMAPLTVMLAPPFRRAIGDHPRPKIPLTYPMPSGPRKIPEGFDD